MGIHIRSDTTKFQFLLFYPAHGQKGNFIGILRTWGRAYLIIIIIIIIIYKAQYPKMLKALYNKIKKLFDLVSSLFSQSTCCVSY